MTSDECAKCGVRCIVGLSFAVKNANTGAWEQWRWCRGCAIAEGEIADARVQRAIEQAERAGA